MIIEIVVGIIIAYYAVTFVIPGIWDILVSIKDWLEEHGDMIVGSVVLLLIILAIMAAFSE